MLKGACDLMEQMNFNIKKHTGLDYLSEGPGRHETHLGAIGSTGLKMQP